MINDKLIIVASHKKIPSKELDYPYKEVYRIENQNNPENFKHTTFSIEGTKNPSLTWSEYPAFYSCFPLPNDIQMVGLVHYRCTFDLGNTSNKKLKYSDRYNFYMNQSKLLDKYYNKTIVSKTVYKKSLFDQLRPYLNNSINTDIFSITCDYFDSNLNITDISSKQFFQNTNIFYHRNLFISNIDFANKWYEISYKLIKFLDQFNTTDFNDPRWGAYILERFFSLYVSMLKKETPEKVIEKQLVWFS